MPARIYLTTGDNILVNESADEVAEHLREGSGPVRFDAPDAGDKSTLVYVNPAHVVRVEELKGSVYEERSVYFSR